MTPSNDPVAWPGWGPWPPTQNLARPYWGALQGDTRLGVWLGWQEPAQVRGCLFSGKGVEFWGWEPETPL